MKKFLKDNSYFIVRMIVYQLGVMIMGLVTALATVNSEVSWLYPVSSVFCIVFYLFLIGMAGYENGQKDGIRVEAGKMPFQPMRFFLVGLAANVLNILLGLLTLVFRLIISAPLAGRLDPDVLYTPEWAASAYSICNMIARFIQSMYLGLTQTLSFENVILLVLIPFPAVLVSGISYLLGVKFKDGFLKKQNKDDNTKGTKRYS